MDWRANGIARVPRAPLVVRGDTLGGPLFRRESFIQGVKWLTFVGKAPLQVLESFRVKLLCVPRKILIAQATHAFKGKVLQGLFFSPGCHGISFQSRLAQLHAHPHTSELSRYYSVY